MRKTPLVSIITPAFNAEKTLREAVQSILNQSFTDFEYIIIDDASTDKTWSLIQELSADDKRIKTFRNERNVGIAGTRNRGLSLSQGKYIAWQDADDISMPQRLEKQINVLMASTGVGIVGGYLEFFNNSGVQSIRKYQTDDKDLRRTIFRYSPVAQPAAMIRRECFDIVGEYDLEYPPAEDIEMSFRIGTYFKFANVPEVLLKYRMSESSATYQKLFTIEKQTLKARLKNINNPKYSFSLQDFLFNLIQYTIIIWLPATWKISLFNLIRND